MNKKTIKYKENVGIDAILLAAYFAITPMHQTLVLSNGSTVVKYLAFLVMIACAFHGYIEYRKFLVVWDLIMPVGLMLGWFALSVLWSDSRPATISTLISIGSYCALMLIAGSRQWNEREKKFFLFVLILSCTFYAVNLIRTAATVRRATLVFLMGDDEKDADQNAVALNISIGALAAFSCFLQRKKGLMRWLALGCMAVILAGVISTGSRGGLIALLAGAGYLYFKASKYNPQLRNSFFIIPVGILLFLWLLLDLNLLGNSNIVTRFQKIDASGMNGRMEIWEQYLGALLQRPVGFLSGYGLGCDTIAHAAYMMRDWYRASHNDFISALFWGGIPGLLLTGSFVRHVWQRSMRRDNLLGCACIILALVGSLDINFFKTYGWWNAMLIAYIGIGQTANTVEPSAWLSLYRYEQSFNKRI